MPSAAQLLLSIAQCVCDRLAAAEMPEASVIGSCERFDDDGLTQLLRDAARLRAETDALITAVAGVVANRSERALGYSGLAQREGHRTPIALVQSITGGSRLEAARQVRLGHVLSEAETAAGTRRAGIDTNADTNADRLDRLAETPWHEPVTRAVMEHRISTEAAGAILRGLGDPSEQCNATVLREAARDVIDCAVGLNADELVKRARWARDRIDPGHVERLADERYRARSWRFGRNADGAKTAWVVFDDESAAWIDGIVDSALSPRRGGPRFVGTEVEARAQELVKDPRTNDQLVFDTIVDVLHAGACADAAHVFGARQPGVRVVTTIRNVTDRGANGVAIGSGYYENTGEAVPSPVVDRHLCNSGHVPIVIDENGCPLDVGREQRLFTSKQRIALHVRDGGCMFPHCDSSANYTEAHHINEWVADRGATNIADGILLCRHHHMLLHNNRWKIRREKTEYRLIPPPAIDPTRTPIRLRSKSPLEHLRTG